MSFAWPHLLWLLALPALLLGWELRRRQQGRTTFHPKIVQAEAGRNQLRLAGQGAAPAARARLWLCLGLAFTVVALARPQWGRLEEPVFDQSREILIAVDLSRSMLAQDVKPSRLDRAKLLINSLLEKLQGERVGLAVFSGTAFLQSPLSPDYEILREFLPSLGPDYLPEGGTNYRALLDTAVEAFSAGTAADRFLIVLSDGEATDDNWQALVPTLKQKGIRAICLGIGTPAGAMIPDGNGAFVKDDRGAVVLSKLESNTLQQLARETDGVYRDASSWVDLASVLKQTVEAGRKGEFTDKRTVRLVERFQWALAPALLCLMISFWREFPVRPRPRALKLSPPGSSTAALALLLGLAGLVAGAPALRAGASAAPGTPSAQAPAPAASAPEPTALGKIVSRLSAQDVRSGRDWAELARETVTWGQKLQTDHQPVPPGPVDDALAAVAEGEKLDAGTADWSKLRGELQALLKKPEPPPPQPKPQDQKDQQQKQQQQQDQKPSSQGKSPQSQDQQQSSKDGQSPKGGDQSQPPPQDQSKEGGKPPTQGKSAFGDMKEPAQPPPPPASPGEMQKVGGAPQDKAQAPAKTDPALAMPLQKLQQIRDGDSPAQLFQLMEGKPEPAPAKSGKNW